NVAQIGCGVLEACSRAVICQPTATLLPVLFSVSMTGAANSPWLGQSQEVDDGEIEKLTTFGVQVSETDWVCGLPWPSSSQVITKDALLLPPDTATGRDAPAGSCPPAGERVFPPPEGGCQVNGPSP